MDCSFCKNVEEDKLADLTAKISPEFDIAIETVAVEPRPMIGPLVQLISIGTEEILIQRDDLRGFELFKQMAYNNNNLIYIYIQGNLFVCVCVLGM